MRKRYGPKICKECFFLHDCYNTSYLEHEEDQGCKKFHRASYYRLNHKKHGMGE